MKPPTTLTGSLKNYGQGRLINPASIEPSTRNAEMEEEEIQEEIRRRALEKAGSLQKENQKLLHTQDTLDALEEVTGLPRAELEKIAKEVRSSHDQDHFFSIKRQILLTIILGLALLSAVIVVVWLL
jgi:hypothetical protein